MTANYGSIVGGDSATMQRSAQCKRMKRRRQIGGGEEYSGSAKDIADEALSVGILLWRIRASKALKYRKP